jgi:hypothetical protein
MRRVSNRVVRGLAAVVVIVALAGSASAAGREDRDRGQREKANPIVKAVKKIIRVLGDGLTIPRP